MKTSAFVSAAAAEDAGEGGVAREGSRGERSDRLVGNRERENASLIELRDAVDDEVLFAIETKPIRHLFVLRRPLAYDQPETSSASSPAAVPAAAAKRSRALYRSETAGR